jgi:hypothetical protein
VVVDPGHGAGNNTGNWGCHCQSEADEVLSEANALAEGLRRHGAVVMQTRTTAHGSSYAARIKAIERFRPLVVISLHTDARGQTAPHQLAPDGGICWSNPFDPGFAILWSDDAVPTVVDARAQWGRALSVALRDAGFGAYSGRDYGGLYRHDTVEPGCFIDIRPRKKSVYPIEVMRWAEPATRDALVTAVASAIRAMRSPR